MIALTGFTVVFEKCDNTVGWKDRGGWLSLLIPIASLNSLSKIISAVLVFL